MGYRALLKKVLATIEEETGSLPRAILEGQPGDRFSKRDLGELRALAAELCREGAPRGQALWHASNGEPRGGDRP
jgi:hypothetical protein